MLRLEVNQFSRCHLWQMEDKIHELDLNINPHLKRLQYEMIVVFDDEKYKGRLLAYFNLTESKPQGYIGYFDCCDDTEVSKLLFDRADEFFLKNQIFQIEGPVDLSIHNRYRLMLTGFKLHPYLGEPTNPNYFAKLWELRGFKIKQKWFTWDCPVGVVDDLMENFLQKSAPLDENSDFHIQFLNPKNLNDFKPKIHQAVEEIFKDNYGIKPLSLEEFNFYYQSFAHILSEDGFIYLTDKNNNEILGYVFGYIQPSLHQTNLMVAYVMGIKKELRKTGLIHNMLYLWFQKNLLKGKNIGQLELFIGALTKEGPTFLDPFGPPSRSYAVMTKNIEIKKIE